MADLVSYDDFAKLELHIAKVIGDQPRPCPNADRLLLIAGGRGRRAEADRGGNSPALPRPSSLWAS